MFFYLVPVSLARRSSSPLFFFVVAKRPPRFSSCATFVNVTAVAHPRRPSAFPAKKLDSLAHIMAHVWLFSFVGNVFQPRDDAKEPGRAEESSSAVNGFRLRMKFLSRISFALVYRVVQEKLVRFVVFPIPASRSFVQVDRSKLQLKLLVFSVGNW